MINNKNSRFNIHQSYNYNKTSSLHGGDDGEEESEGMSDTMKTVGIVMIFVLTSVAVYFITEYYQKNNKAYGILEFFGLLSIYIVIGAILKYALKCTWLNTITTVCGLMVTHGSMYMKKDCDNHMFKGIFGTAAGSSPLYWLWAAVPGFLLFIYMFPPYGTILQQAETVAETIGEAVDAETLKELLESIPGGSLLKPLVTIISPFLGNSSFILKLIFIIGTPGILKLADLFVCGNCEKRLDLLLWLFPPRIMFFMMQLQVKFLVYLAKYIPIIGLAVKAMESGYDATLGKLMEKISAFIIVQKICSAIPSVDLGSLSGH